MEKKKARIVMSALSQDTRLSVFMLLVGTGDDGMAAGAISDATRTSPTAMSAHLAILAQAGLVRSKKVGRSVVYKAVPKTAGDLAEFLKGICDTADH
jgi:DNA-binding transcriptional ArsR family regulator